MYRTEAGKSVSEEYEVFLSFRGEDTRKGFADHLYRALYRYGVRVFRDNESLHVGEEIRPQLIQGIEQSKISIPIFSKNYADSKWCLREFTLMMKCRKELNQAVLPIFYDVTPNEVQHQTGAFHMAFAENPNRYDEKTLREWRDALSGVGSLKGWHLANMCNGHEGELVTVVVNDVMKRLNKCYISMRDNLVGIGEHINEVMGLLEIGMQDVRMIGISGMGGIGKSTLANAVYNQIVDQFEYHGFLEDIRNNASQPFGIQVLQCNLVTQLLRDKCRDFATVSDGKNMLRSRFRGKKVLILLDDVDKKEQLKELGVTDETDEHMLIDWFGKGSRIIVTTRDSSILDGSRDKIYDLKEMKTHHALQLFCNNAFEAHFPRVELEKLSNDIAVTTGGLPLALEVVGSLLRTKDKKFWKRTLKTLKLQSVPDEKVEKLLRISFEALSEAQKYIFLDIACFHVGVDKRLPSYMWDGDLVDQNSPEYELVALCSKSLIRIKSNHTIWMHDLLRDLGRKIVQREFNEQGRRIWLWRSKEATNLLMEQKYCYMFMPWITPTVEAICLDGAHTTEPFTDKYFRALPNLKFMQIYGVDLAGNFQTLLTELRWLSWKMTSFKHTLQNLHPKNLVVLNLSGSTIRDNWFDSSMQGAANLKVLNLSHCSELTRTPDLSVFPQLERLILQGCRNLEVINSSVGKLSRLVYLNLDDCRSVQKLPQRMSVSLNELIIDSSGITELPESICLLVKVQRVSLRRSRIKELPYSIRWLKSLVELNLVGADVESFPCSIGKLKKLKVIDASQCKHLEGDIPIELGRLSKLEVLKMSCTGIVNLPETMGTLSQLQVLDLKGCHQLVALPHLPNSLVRLNLTCKSEVPIPNLPDLINLEVLSFNSCEEMVKVPHDIMELKKLKELLIVDCIKLQSICSLPINLNKLDIQGCCRLMEIQGIGKVVSLSTLSVKSKDGTSCPLERLPDLSKLKRLHMISIENCKLVEIQGFSSLCCLTDLTIINCRCVERLPDLSNLRSLKRLVLSKCEKLQKLEGLDKLDALVEFDMSHCCAINELPNLSKLKLLAALNSSYCANLEDLGGIVGLTSLKKLDISNCGAIKKLPDLSNMKSLEILKVSHCAEIIEFPDLSNLKLLRILEARECTKLQCLDGLGELEALMYLEIQYCKSIQRLPNLSELQLLKTLQAEGCEKLEGLDGLDELESLSTLNISNCKAIEQLPDLSELKLLKELQAKGCEKLQYLEGLDMLNALKELNIEGCKAMRRLNS